MLTVLHLRFKIYGLIFNVWIFIFGLTVSILWFRVSVRVKVMVWVRVRDLFFLRFLGLGYRI